ncbi:unnamed protein product, partial [Choristocarpus tenellus]
LLQVKLTKDNGREGFPITALRETNVLLSLHHPNIVRVLEMVIGSTLDKVYMVMEYFDHDLKSVMSVMRDKETSNLLYNHKGKLAVCDFGLARKYEDPIRPYTFKVVTMWYRCPELLLGE